MMWFGLYTQYIHNRGMTLIEMMFVIGTGTGLLTLAFVPMDSLVEGARLRSATEAMYGDLQQARAQAVSGNSLVYVNISPGSTWCYGLSANSACDCSASSCILQNTLQKNSSDHYSNITLSTTNLDGDVSFEPLHGKVVSGLNSDAVMFTLTSASNHSSHIRINKQGSITVCSNDLSGYPLC